MDARGWHGTPLAFAGPFASVLLGRGAHSLLCCVGESGTPCHHASVCTEVGTRAVTACMGCEWDASGVGSGDGNRGAASNMSKRQAAENA